MLVTAQPYPEHAQGTGDTLGCAGGTAAVVLAPSLNNSAATQQEFHIFILSASTSRPKARVQNVLCAHSCLFWVDFLAVFYWYADHGFIFKHTLKFIAIQYVRWRTSPSWSFEMPFLGI